MESLINNHPRFAKILARLCSALVWSHLKPYYVLSCLQLLFSEIAFIFLCLFWSESSVSFCLCLKRIWSHHKRSTELLLVIISLALYELMSNCLNRFAGNPTWDECRTRALAQSPSSFWHQSLLYWSFWHLCRKGIGRPTYFSKPRWAETGLRIDMRHTVAHDFVLEVHWQKANLFF